MATTDTTPVQPINYQSGLPQLMELLKYSSGSKENQKEGGSQTQTQQGQSGPLEAILAQIMDPNGLQNMVANLFAQGAAQVPGLTSQYANAVGGRVSNNTLLGSSLAQLNQSLAQSIANAVIQQQQTAVGAATNLANTNKATTTSKDLTTQRTTQPGNPGQGLATTLGVVAAGTAANRIGKKFFPADAPAQPPVAAMPSPNVYQGIEFQNNTPPTVGDIPTVTDAPFNAPFIPGGDFISGSDSFDAVGGASNAVDTSAGAGEIGDQVFSDIPVDDFIPDVGGFDDFSGFFFADGGRVKGVLPQRNWTRAGAVPYADGGKVRQAGYADGGNVRGKPNMGNAAPVARTAAVNLPQQQATLNLAPSQAMVANAAQGKKRSNSVNDNSPEGAAGAGSPSAASGSPDAGTSSSGFSMGMGVAGGLAAAMGLAAGAPAGMAIAAAVDAMAKSAMAKAVVEALTTATDISSSIANDVSATTAGIESAMGTSQTGDFSAGAFGTSFGSPSGMSASNAGQTSGATDEGSGYAGEAGMSGTGEAGAADAGASEGGGDFGGGDAGGDAGGGDGGGDGGGGGGDGGGWADGGITPVSGKKVKNDRKDRIEHEGRGTVRGDASDGIDNTLIAATPGEYVLPIETVDFIGQDVLDDLVAMTHTPRRSGTHG